MRKFKGEINGVEYTDKIKFTEDARRLALTAGPEDPIHMSYSLEYVDDDQDKDIKRPTEKTVPTNKEPEIHIGTLTERESEIMCEAVEKIRDIVNETAAKIQEYIEADAATYRNMREFGVMTDAAITKIRWIVQSLPIGLRKELCNSIYDATKEMSDNINSELVDLRYELAKDQDLISEKVGSIEDDIDDINDEIKDLEEERTNLCKDIDKLQDEYSNNDRKIETISTACNFFDELVSTFTM